VILAGAGKPLTFFGYPNVPSLLAGESRETITLAGPGHAPDAALERLAEALGASAVTAPPDLAQPAAFAIPAGRLTPDRICAALAALQPEGAIVVDEGVTTGMAYHGVSAGARPFTLLTLTGGALGFGMPAAVGAALACPDRKVIAFQADGAGLYTLQALWTMARENLNVTAMVASNGRYDILRYELLRLGIIVPGAVATRLTELPGVDWVRVAEGLGVPASRADTAEGLVRELERALGVQGPRLIEMKI
jgi:acetolactate synthase I/II/III large subunit